MGAEEYDDDDDDDEPAGVDVHGEYNKWLDGRIKKSEDDDDDDDDDEEEEAANVELDAFVS